jgi:hypothetical protein
MIVPFKRVIIESPYSGEVERNKAYLKVCMLDSITRGEAPYASHKLYTDVLDDNDKDERRLGIELGFAWLKVADLVAFYIDFGMSPGMLACWTDLKTLKFRVPFEKRRVKEDVLNQFR